MPAHDEEMQQGTEDRSGETLIRKLEQRDRISPEEKQILETAVVRVREVRMDQDLVREGDRPTESTLLLDGFAARYKDLANGRRQITALHVAGDFVDLHSFLLHRMDHGVVTLTDCRIGVVPHGTLRRITERHPHLARLLWLSTLIDGAIHREWLVAMGRRSSLDQMAHLLCELFLRLQAVGRTERNSFRLPLTQAELGDTLGLSTVHVNRIIQELRAAGLITWRGPVVTIENWDGLVQAAEFDPSFLNLMNEPR
jgi:CRP-like cAMP-binding protein